MKDLDMILIFDFLSNFVEGAGVFDITEEQLMVWLPHMLAKPSALEYRSNSSESRAAFLSSWSEAVQYFLGTHATEVAICNTTDML